MISNSNVWIDDDIFLTDEIEPIPLTEEWLLKFGLKKDYYIFYCRIVDNGCTVYFKGNFITKVESVHQLQNLYFALTGEELKIIY